MQVSPELALKLVPVFEGYFTLDEFRELVALFEVSIESLNDYQPKWLAVARELTQKLDQGNTRRLLDNLLDLAESRSADGIAHTTFERRDFHYRMASILGEAKKLLETSASPSEITIAAGNVFSAKSMVRELLETATADVLVVDPYVGLGTLDCFRNLTVPIRLLTGNRPDSVESGFDRAMAAFNAEGHHLEVKHAQQLHDRHLVLNGRCWLVGGSLKDAGKKPFNCIEMTDLKGIVVADLETKWRAATPYP